MDSIRMTLPLPPSLTNSGKGRSRHWRALEKEKDAYWQRLDLVLYMTGRLPRGQSMPPAMFQVPSPPHDPIERAEASGVLYLWNPMDDGNALARLKWLEDWLVRRGYLRNDSRKHLRWAALPEQVIDRANPRVELTVRPLP